MTTDLWWLEPGEKLLWSDKPLLYRYLRQRLGAEIWGGPIVLCIAILLYYRALPAEILQSEFLSFVVFVLAVSLMFKPIWVFWERGRTFYALTDRRAVIDIDVDSRSLPVGDLQLLRVRARKDGSGDIVFSEALVAAGESSWVREEGFIAIKNVNAVERLVRETIDRHKAGHAGPPTPDGLAGVQRPHDQPAQGSGA
jgi:hypothetical protein